MPLQNQNMVCAFNKAAKILTGIGGCFVIVGVIIAIAGTVGAAASLDMETQGGQMSFSIQMPHQGSFAPAYIVYVRADYDCDTTPVVSTAVQSPTGAQGTWTERCRSARTDEDSWEASHEPPLRSAGTLYQATDSACDPEIETEGCLITGSYRITCSTNCWVWDSMEEVTEAVGGLMAAMGMFVIVVILNLVGALLCCIACCCCCQGPDKGASPPPVQGMVVGQPVGSA